MLFRCIEFKELFTTWSEIMAQNREWLIELDSVVGDGDLGLTMSDGFAAASTAANAYIGADIGKLSYSAGKAMASAVPSTMGTLMASGLMNAGKVFLNVTELDLAGMARWFEAYFNGVQNRGSAQLGDKTFLDGLFGAIQSLCKDAESQVPIDKAAINAEIFAERDFLATKTLLAKHGRAATRGEKSRELLDPGAAVAFLLIQGFKLTVQKFLVIL